MLQPHVSDDIGYRGGAEHRDSAESRALQMIGMGMVLSFIVSFALTFGFVRRLCRMPEYRLLLLFWVGPVWAVLRHQDYIAPALLATSLISAVLVPVVAVVRYIRTPPARQPTEDATP